MILVGTAGTYTAVIVLGLDGATRVVLLVIAWAIAAVGVGIRMLWLDAPSGLVAAVYLVAGWQIVLDLPAYADALTGAELVLLAVGGALYSIGAVVYARQRPEPVAGRVRLPRGLPRPRRHRRPRPLVQRVPPDGLTCCSTSAPLPVSAAAP